MRVLLDSSSGPSPAGTQFKDKTGVELGRSPFYSISPYSSPHVFREIKDGYVVFEDYDSTRLLLNHHDTLTRVSPYGPEEISKFCLGFSTVPTRKEEVAAIRSNLLEFLKVELEEFKRRAIGKHCQ